MTNSANLNNVGAKSRRAVGAGIAARRTADIAFGGDDARPQPRHAATTGPLRCTDLGKRRGKGLRWRASSMGPTPLPSPSPRAVRVQVGLSKAGVSTQNNVGSWGAACTPMFPHLGGAKPFSFSQHRFFFSRGLAWSSVVPLHVWRGCAGRIMSCTEACMGPLRVAKEISARRGSVLQRCWPATQDACSEA